MSFLEWLLSITLLTVYFVALFTICLLTFKKGYIALGIVGIFFPLLWLIGAILPPKRGSSMDYTQGLGSSTQYNPMGNQELRHQ